MIRKVVGTGISARTPERSEAVKGGREGEGVGKKDECRGNVEGGYSRIMVSFPRS